MADSRWLLGLFLERVLQSRHEQTSNLRRTDERDPLVVGEVRADERPGDGLTWNRQAPAEARVEEGVDRHLAKVHARVHRERVLVAATHLETQADRLVAVPHSRRRL